jgi:hypothetical protein
MLQERKRAYLFAATSPPNSPEVPLTLSLPRSTMLYTEQREWMRGVITYESRRSAGDTSHLFNSSLVSFHIDKLTIFTSLIVELHTEDINATCKFVRKCRNETPVAVACSNVLIRLHRRQALSALNSSGISAVMYSTSSSMAAWNQGNSAAKLCWRCLSGDAGGCAGKSAFRTKLDKSSCFRPEIRNGFHASQQSRFQQGLLLPRCRR